MKLLSLRIILFLAVFLLTACGKATVKPGAVAEGFTLASLRAGTTAVIVDAGVALSDFPSSYREAFAERFGSGDSLSSYLAGRLVDSLNHGVPKIPAALAPILNARHILVVRDLALTRDERELPNTLLPAVGHNSMQPAGGGTSQSWTFSFVVSVWEVAHRLPEEGAVQDVEYPSVAQDTAHGLLRHSFSVSGTADVPLYAYKTALVEAVNVAASKAARHLRGL